MQSTETKDERKARKIKEKQKKEQAQLNASVSKYADKNYVVCLKWGAKYDASYVNKLYSMVDRNITIPYEFVCFTDDTKGIDKNIKTYSLPVLPATGWWFKPYFVGNELPFKGTLLFLDLDVIVFNNIDKLFEFEKNKFCIIRDFNRSVRSNWDRMNSSVFRTFIGQNDTIWQDFKRNPANQMTRYRGDQDWMFKNIKNHKFWPDDWIQSYKWEMRDRRDLYLDEKRKRNFKVDAPPKINPNTCIAVFHGEPNPADANDSWVQQHWG